MSAKLHFKPTRLSIDQSRTLAFLTIALSLTAGSCDVITFIGLGGLFTAHITGNVVVMVARVVIGERAPLSYILSVPMFVVALFLTTILAGLLGRARIGSLRPLLILQLLLLFGCLIICVDADARVDPFGERSLVAGMLAVSAMGVQNAIEQVSIEGVPATAVMTTNISRFVVDFVVSLEESDRNLAGNAGVQARHTATAIVGFAAGCALGAGCEFFVGLWAFALPTGLAFLALVIALATRAEGQRNSSVGLS